MKHLKIILPAIFFILVLVGSLLFRLPEELLVRFEPVTSSKPDYGMLPVVVVNDERIFTLFAALNAAGFDDEYSGMAMHPVRQKIREALGSRSISNREELKNYFQKAATYHLVNWTLQRGSAPEFNRAEPGWWVTMNAAPFYQLDQNLAAFYQEADLAGLWKLVEQDYQAAADIWQPAANQSLLRIKNYTGLTQLPFKQVVIIPNLLDSHYSGYGPQIGDTAYVIAGPTDSIENLTGLMEHEMLHSMIGPVLDQNSSVIKPAVKNELYQTLKTTMPSSYGSWNSILEESLIRAINLRMIADEDIRNQQISRLVDEGFLLIPVFNEALKDYEQSNQTLDSYLPLLLKRLETVQLHQ